ncbi:MAG: hypothetical protein ABR591_05140 [Candidatus Velthaea sp.]
MALFVRLTIGVALAIVAIVASLFIVKIVLVAAVIAALVIAGAFIANFAHRRLGIGRATLVRRM